MKKCFLNKFIITFCTIPAFALSAFAGVDFDAGMNAYNNGNYDFAKVLFAKAIKLDEKDVNSRYMYCQILTKEKKYKEAKEEYKKILAISPDSEAATLARQGVQNIEMYEKKLAEEAKKNNSNDIVVKKDIPQANNTETNYVKNAYRGGQKYLRERGIVRIYIEPDETFKPLMQQAYSEWQSAIGSNVIFSYAGNKNDATDVVSFSNVSDTKGMQEGGICQYKIEGNTLKGSNISINAYDANGKPLPKDVVYHTMLHEIGHSLGIMGHSPYDDDIMAQGVKKFSSHLSQRDKNTIQDLYKYYLKQPDIKDIQKAKTEEYSDIAKRIPNHPSGYTDMGDELMSEGQYEKALIYYKKAESLQPSVSNYFKQIDVYNKLKDIDNASVYYKKVLSLDKSNKIALNNLLAIYQKQLRYREAKAVLDGFIANNPKLEQDKEIKDLKKVFSEENIKIIESRKKFLYRE